MDDDTPSDVVPDDPLHLNAPGARGEILALGMKGMCEYRAFLEIREMELLSVELDDDDEFGGDSGGCGFFAGL